MRLLGDGAGDVGVSVTKVRHADAGDAIDVPTVLVVPEGGPLAPNDRQLPLRVDAARVAQLGFKMVHDTSASTRDHSGSFSFERGPHRAISPAVSEDDPAHARPDRFGRTKDQYWDGYNSTADVDRFKYAYDYTGNRKYRDIDSAIYSTNDKDQAYTYDGLHRLKTSLARRGRRKEPAPAGGCAQPPRGSRRA